MVGKGASPMSLVSNLVQLDLTKKAETNNQTAQMTLAPSSLQTTAAKEPSVRKPDFMRVLRNWLEDLKQLFQKLQSQWRKKN